MERFKRFVLTADFDNKVENYGFYSYLKSPRFSDGEKINCIMFYNGLTHYYIELSEYMRTPETKAAFDSYLKNCGVNADKWRRIFIDVTEEREIAEIEKRENSNLFF